MRKKCLALLGLEGFGRTVHPCTVGRSSPSLASPLAKARGLKDPQGLRPLSDAKEPQNKARPSMAATTYAQHTQRLLLFETNCLRAICNRATTSKDRVPPDPDIHCISVHLVSRHMRCV